jgi:hypothetical protein
MSSSCKQFDGIIANNETIEQAKECLHLAMLYIDRTVEPAVFRYIEYDNSYEITGWKRENGKIYYIVRLKDGTVLQLNELELKHIDVLLRVKKKFSKS